MKEKIISTLLALTMMGSTCAFAADVELSFSQEKFSINVDATDLPSSGAITTITIMDNDGEPSLTNLPVYSYVYKTNASGDLNTEVLLPYALKSGRCYVYLDSLSFNESAQIVILNENDEDTIALLEDIVEFETADELTEVFLDAEKYELLGLDLSGYSEDVVADAASICLGEISDIESLSGVEFKNTIAKCIVYADIKNGGDVDDGMKSHAEAFGTTYEEYSAYSSDIRAEFGEIFKSATTGEKSLSTIYSDSMLLARIRCVDSWGDLRDITLANADYLGIDVSDDSDYKDIKDNKRYKVFVELYSDRESLNSVEEVKELFETSVEATLDSQKNESSSGGGGGGGGGSSSDLGKPTGQSVNVSKDYEENIPVSTVKPYEPIEKFSDIKEHYSREYVDAMISKGIINGYNDGTFRPDNLITRAEISKILSLALGLDIASSQTSFADVAVESWYAPYVAAMAESGYINGYNGQFMPADNLKRQDIAVIMANILANAEEADVPAYKDVDDISDYAKESVAKMYALGIMTGSDSEFRPQDGITRAEVAVVVTRLLEILENK